MNKNRISTLIFDFDGTLADTLPNSFNAFQTVFETYDGKQYSDEEVKYMFGPIEPEIIRGHLGSEEVDRAIDLYFKTYTDNHERLVKADSGVHDMLEHFKEKGYKLAVVTGKSRRSLDISMAFLNMDDVFDYTISGNDVNRFKPDPEGVLDVLDELGVDKDAAIFVGDSDADITAGKEAGLYTVGAHWLPNIQTAEFSVEPDTVFADVQSFTDCIEFGK